MTRVAAPWSAATDLHLCNLRLLFSTAAISARTWDRRPDQGRRALAALRARPSRLRHAAASWVAQPSKLAVLVDSAPELVMFKAQQPQSHSIYICALS